MKVLVVGGSGFIGHHLCAELHSRGHDVVAMSRNPTEAALPDGVETVVGDVTDYDSLVDGFAGVDVVVNLVALSPLFEPKGGNRMHDVVHWQGTENVVKAAETQGVSRLVQLSALGADSDGDTAYVRAKGKAERSVKASSLDWVIFRPSVVFGEGGDFVSFTKRLKGMFAPGVPLYPLPGNGRTRFQPIWVGDFVPMLADACEGDDHVGQTYEVGGPQKLTLREITEMVYDAEGKSVTIVPLPMPLAGVGLSVLGAIPGFPMGPDQYRSLTFDNTIEHNDAVAVFDVDLDGMETLAAYLAERA